jgi:hypothetical protein
MSLGEWFPTFQTILPPSCSRIKKSEKALRVLDPSRWKYHNPSKRRKTIHPITVSHYRRTCLLTENLALIFLSFISYITINKLPNAKQEMYKNFFTNQLKSKWPGGVLWPLHPFYRRCPRPPLILAGSRVADEIRLLARFSHRSDPLIARGITTVVSHNSSTPHFTPSLSPF